MKMRVKKGSTNFKQKLCAILKYKLQNLNRQNAHQNVYFKNVCLKREIVGIFEEKVRQLEKVYCFPSFVLVVSVVIF